MDLHLLKYGKKVEKRFQADFTQKKVIWVIRVLIES